ncbi:MAG TPA: hypothetical protein DEG44_03665 [Candidatus Kerfeldbacteria bacterium]|nr:hypothetical protein [Candidatus Kerfeldbacteria bacterium]
MTKTLQNGSLRGVSIRFRQIILAAIISLLRLTKRLLLVLRLVLLFLINPIYIAMKWVLKPVVLWCYSQYLKVLARLKRSAFMQNKVLFIFGNKYFIHVLVTLLSFFVASTNILQAKEVSRDEVFAQDSALYEIVNPEGTIGEEIVQVGLIPDKSTTVSYVDTAGSMVATIPNLDPAAERPRNIGDQLALLDTGSALLGGSVVETNIGVRAGTTEYKVKDGDTIGGISERFGLSVSTLLWANGLNSSSYIKPGQTLKVPAASGYLYTVKDGDTLDKIVSTYNGSLDETRRVNDIGSDGLVPVGAEILIVDGTPPPPPPPPVQRYYSSYGSAEDIYRNDNYTPVVTGQQLNWPVGCHSSPTTYWGHGLARDIACPMGTPIYAAEEGTVYIRSAGGWGGGYGNYLDIVHPNGMMTRYAHMSAFNVSNGQYVSRGEVVGFVGSTGRSTGPHLHFEVYVGGVKQEPLYYIQ